MAAISNDFYIGGSVAAPLYHFGNRSLVLNSVTGVFTVDVLANELPVDEFSLSVRYRYDTDLIYAPVGASGYRDASGKIYRLKNSGVAQYLNLVPAGSTGMLDADTRTMRVFNGWTPGSFLDIPYGTPVFWYLGGSFYRKGYVSSIERVGRYIWEIRCISGVGLLDAMEHDGGLYTGQSFRTVAQSIIGSAFRVAYAADVASTAIYGRLPRASARENLHRLLFAVGAAMLRDSAATDYRIVYLDETERAVPDSRIALGGSVTRQLPSNAAEITEHGFYQADTDPIRVLFDNRTTVIADHQTVVFSNAPIYDLAVSGSLVIEASSVNHAVVSGVGVLTGRPYSHTRRIVRLSSRKAGEPERLRQVTDNELISTANSLNVAQRVLGYYGSAKTVAAKLLLEGEYVGQTLSLLDPFGEQTTAILSKATVLATSVLGADVELIDGYVPGSTGNNYNNRVLFDASCSWTVPEGVTHIRAVLIGGGQGGQGGYNGRRGLGSSDYKRIFDEELMVEGYVFNKAQTAAPGGSGGQPGQPGKIYIIELDVTPGSVISIVTGRGGAGGARHGHDGALGTATTITVDGVTYSSDSGLPTSGYFDVLSQETYALPGVAGQSGAPGGLSDGGRAGNLGGDGLPGQDLGEDPGGAGGVGYVGAQPYVRASGGGGGGAAFGAAGSPGGDGILTESIPQTTIGGNGGDGADAQPPVRASGYGTGGTGGNGGGGGGNPGLCENFYGSSHAIQAGVPGAPGQGSDGGGGAHGCGILYH